MLFLQRSVFRCILCNALCLIHRERCTSNSKQRVPSHPWPAEAETCISVAHSTEIGFPLVTDISYVVMCPDLVLIGELQAHAPALSVGMPCSTIRCLTSRCLRILPSQIGHVVMGMGSVLGILSAFRGHELLPVLTNTFAKTRMKNSVPQSNPVDSGDIVVPG